MAKTPNASKSAPFTVTVSEQSAQLLESLAKKGIYGRSGAEVAGRFIDDALAKFIVAPRYRIPTGDAPQEVE
jgi:hypothetical protein